METEMDTRKKAASSVSFEVLIKRLTGNYPPVDDDRLEGVIDNYRRLFNQVGWDRFAAAVDRCINDSPLMFLPSIKEFKEQLPPPPEQSVKEAQRLSWERDMRAKRAQHPEMFFGWGDLAVILNLASQHKEHGKKHPTEAEYDAAIEAARTKYKYHLKPLTPKEQQEFNHFDN